ncbi:MAG: hypothetical protein N3D12_01225 [Candidatus Methanomethyliaceae archaeon]|nr:hypothetical protein [Candidatus Methanomethyliaceae archaeon]
MRQKLGSSAVRGMRLEKFSEFARILDPRKKFSEVSQEIEVRVDPLTGGVSRVNLARGLRPKQEIKVEAPIQPDCPFCPQNIDRETPKFPEDFVREGRIKRGRATIFPNLYPLADLHGVCVFTDAHKLELDKFSKEELMDGFKASVDFFRMGAEMGAIFHFLGWNHLPNAGASILHPHFQLIASKMGLRAERELFEACERYWRRNERSYWSDLEEERYSERYVGENDGIMWVAPWAPLGAYEVLGFSTQGVSSLTEFGEKGIEAFSEGIVRILRGLWNLGVRAVNMAVYSFPDRREWFSLHARIMARPSGSTTDRAFLEIYGSEVGLTAPPEAYAKILRSYFKV